MAKASSDFGRGVVSLNTYRDESDGSGDNIANLSGAFVLPRPSMWLPHGLPMSVAGPGQMQITQGGIHCRAYRSKPFGVIVKELAVMSTALIVFGVGMGIGLTYLSAHAGWLFGAGAFCVVSVLMGVVLYFRGAIATFYDSDRPVEWLLPWGNVERIEFVRPTDMFGDADMVVIRVVNHSSGQSLYFSPQTNAFRKITLLKSLRPALEEAA